MVDVNYYWLDSASSSGSLNNIGNSDSQNTLSNDNIYDNGLEFIRYKNVNKFMIYNINIQSLMKLIK